jgi:hypothetical protein
MPVNGSTFFFDVMGYLSEYVLPKKLIPMYASASNNWQVKYAVIVEDLPWTFPAEYALTTPTYYRNLLGPNATCVYNYRAPTNTTTFAPQLAAADALGAHLIIDIFTVPLGPILISEVNAYQYKDLVVGVDLSGELMTNWASTKGGCNYECLLEWAGTATPIVPGLTDVFWNNFVGNYSGAWPLYTAAGAYDAIYGLKEAIESAGSTDPNVLLPVIEATDRTGVAGRFKYTAWHDLYSQSVGITWPDGYSRGLMVQWVNGSTFSSPVSGGVMTVVSPTDQLYSRRTLIPPWMYSLAYWDVNLDGRVDMKDIAAVAKAWLSAPGDIRWNMEVDINLDDKVTMYDIGAIARNFGMTASSWPLP